MNEKLKIKIVSTQEEFLGIKKVRHFSHMESFVNREGKR